MVACAQSNRQWGGTLEIIIDGPRLQYYRYQCPQKCGGHGRGSNLTLRGCRDHGAGEIILIKDLKLACSDLHLGLSQHHHSS